MKTKLCKLAVISSALLVVPFVNASSDHNYYPDFGFPTTVGHEYMMEIDLGHEFERIDGYCYTVTFDADKTQFAPLRFNDLDGGHLPGYSAMPSSGELKCVSNPNYQTSRQLMTGKIRVGTSSSEYPLNSFELTIVGVAVPSDSDFMIDASQHTIGNGLGAPYQHNVDGNYTYQIDLLESDVSINGGAATTVGVTFSNSNGQSVITTLSEGITTYVTPKESIDFFWVGDANQSYGSATISVNKVNID